MFRRFDAGEAEALSDLLAGEPWPFHTVETPMFDLRISAEHRGKGLGVEAVRWLTDRLFGEFPHVERIEGTTRQDNVAMRRVFRRCGYVKESHYRKAWPDARGRKHDSVGYAIIRHDWQTGDMTVPDFHDEA